jgi:hypothetical protein
VIDGKKRWASQNEPMHLLILVNDRRRIILNPTESQKSGFESVTFAENEVYGVDILVSSAETGKVSQFRRAQGKIIVLKPISGERGGISYYHFL